MSGSEVALHGHNLSGPMGCGYMVKLQSHSVFLLSCGVLLGSPARVGLLPLPNWWVVLSVVLCSLFGIEAFEMDNYLLKGGVVRLLN